MSAETRGAGQLLANLPIVGGIARRFQARRAELAEDPFRAAQVREERLWLLALLIIFLLAVSLFLLTATGDTTSSVPEIAAPLMLVLGSDITTCFLLVMVLLITAYKKKDTQLTTWAELSHALIANFDLPRLLDLIVTTAMEVTDAERGSVMLLDPEKNVLTIKAAKGIDEDIVGKTRLKLGEGIAGRVAFTGKPLLLSRTEKDRELEPLRHRDQEINSAISVPLRIEERIVGTLNVSESTRPNQFRQEDLRALTLFADQAALALEKAQLYRDSQKQLEKLLSVLDELGRTQAQLVHSEKLASLGVLAGGVAHEINNPLMVILGRTELILMDQGVDEELKRNLETVRHETERIARIVQNLLTFSRKSRQEKIESVDVAEALERTLMLSEHQLTVGNVKVLKEVEPNMPTIDANAGQLQQVFMNLIINAHHAMPDGGELTVRTGTLPDDRVFVEIADTGCGISPEDINRIFDPFFTTKDEGQGTGLGLAVSRNIIENHGGEIGAQSTLGGGTTFRVVLPRVAPSEQTGDSPFNLAAMSDQSPSAEQLLSSFASPAGDSTLS
jgi:signal transduction histidine kinase